MRRTQIKICGLTNVADASAAAEAGADMLGFVFAESQRRVAPADVRVWAGDLPASAVLVGVFVDQPCAEVMRAVAAAGLDQVQLHGDETWHEFAFLSRGIIKRFPVGAADTRGALSLRIDKWGHRLAAALLDPGAGSGRTFDWRLAGAMPVSIPLIIAGGLTPGNVAEAIRIARPYGVDVSSGVEVSPGVKDHQKMRSFVEAVRRVDLEIGGQ